MERGDVQRSPILSLTVVDSRSLRRGAIRPDSRVLVVARREETNPTHPNVVSVPTQRIPEDLYDAILHTVEDLGEGPSSGVSYFRGGAVDSVAINGHHPVIYAVEALLARKLGLADDLERNLCGFRAALRARVAGVALYDNVGTTDVYEPVSMLNVVVGLEDRGGGLPLATSSYSMIAWTSVESFLEGVSARDPALVSPRLDPVAFCVHGVCLQAAQASLEHMLGHPPFPDHDPSGHADSLYTAPRAPYLTSTANLTSSE